MEWSEEKIAKWKRLKEMEYGRIVIGGTDVTTHTLLWDGMNPVFCREVRPSEEFVVPDYKGNRKKV